MKMTKKLTPRKLIAIPVVVLVAAAAFALPASAATPERYVTVNAEGIVQVTPDVQHLLLRRLQLRILRQRAFRFILSTTTRRIKAQYRLVTAHPKALKLSSVTQQVLVQSSMM